MPALFIRGPKELTCSSVSKNHITKYCAKEIAYYTPCMRDLASISLVGWPVASKFHSILSTTEYYDTQEGVSMDCPPSRAKKS